MTEQEEVTAMGVVAFFDMVKTIVKFLIVWMIVREFLDVGMKLVAGFSK